MPRKPKGDKFPLTLHKPTRQYRKRVRGRDYYFGRDRDAALAEWLRVKPDLLAGRRPRPKPVDAISVRELCNRFLHAKRRRVETGELTPGTWSQYFRACERVVDVFGADRAAVDLRADDFADLRADAAKTHGPRALGQFVVLVRSLFGYAFDAEHIDTPVRMGDVFNLPDKRLVRLARAKRGPMLVSASDLRKMLAAADPQLRALILLGVNAGYGSSDCSRLNRADLAAEPGWLSGLREKTAVPRRVPLWGETIAALAAVEAVRPKPKDPTDADAVFLTREGRRFVRHVDRSGEGKTASRRDTLGEAFARLADECRVKLTGRFYVLRHTFRTVVDTVADRPAVDRIMGHGDHTTADHYRERIGDERLLAVTEHVRTWLLAKLA
jgi:integrase